ncbi:MAG: sugar transferase [Pseudomonadota bacterium]
MKYESAVDNRNGAALLADGTVQDDAPFRDGSRASETLKRAMDLLIAVPALVFLLPVLAVIGLCIKLGDGGPMIYRQDRRGLNGQSFRCRKFRTMVVNADQKLDAILKSDPQRAAEWEQDQKLRDDPRITRLGKFLRKTSLDELPQLLNIISGEMSIVGPRPIVSNEVRRYGEFIRYYDSVRPGVLGLWQISGRNDTTYAERVALDTKYAIERSVFLDLKIFVLAIPAVLFSRGAY